MNRSKKKYMPRHQAPKTDWWEFARVVFQTVSWGALFLVLGFGGYVFWLKMHDPNWMPIKHVVIVATGSHIPRETLQKTVDADLKGGFFSLDKYSMRQDLMRLPWVDDVSIRRVWPSELHIRIDEQVPVAQWGDHSLINKRSEIFSPPLDSLPPGLPRLSGPDASEEMIWEQYQSWSLLLKPLDLKIISLNLNSRHSWNLELSNGIRLVLGRVDVDVRFKRFIKLYPTLFSPKASQIRRIDLRYPNGISVQYRS